ncbi:MAG: putative 2OG-Fe(II) oxygenase [Paracoccaceae bacterium]
MKTDESTRSGHDGPPPDWPAGQSISRWAGTEIMVTHFADHSAFAEELCEIILERSKDSKLSHQFPEQDQLNAIKVYDFEKWHHPLADMINARAIAMFHRVAKNTSAEIDASWASVYRTGNFAVPHSHIGSIASVLYMLDPGEGANDAGGQFLFADPRLKPCCRQQKGFMTTPSAPKIIAGTMLMFPGKAVHMVTPYLGKSPRITLSWDLKPKGAKQSAVPTFMTRPS